MPGLILCSISFNKFNKSFWHTWHWHTSSGVILDPELDLIFLMPKAPRRKYVQRYSPYTISAASAAKRRRIVASNIVKAAGAKIRRAGRRYLLRKRKYGRGGPRLPLVMYGRLLRQKIRTVLTYCDTKTLSPGSTSARHWFRLNSLYDPDSTGVGHQPAFADKWEVLYGHYRVTYATWTIVFYPARVVGATEVGPLFGGTNAGENSWVTDSTSSDQRLMPAIVGWEYNNTETARYLQTADMNVVREVGAQSPKNHGYAMTRYGKNTYVLKGRARISTILNDPDAVSTKTNFGSNPTHIASLAVAVLSKDGNATCDWAFDIRIKFHVVLGQGVVEEEN